MKKILYPILVLLILFSSCSEDDLYQLPQGEVLVEEYYSNPDNIDPGLEAIYYNFRFYSAFDMMWGDMGTDDALKGGGEPGDAGGTCLSKQDYTYDPSTSIGPDMWGACYNGIAAVHKQMELINEYMSGGQRDSSMAEAQFIRGFCYYSLAKYFGDVPLVLLGDSAGAIPKSPVSEVWAQVKSDLDSAAMFLAPRSQIDGRVGRADKGAAIGLNCKAASYQKDMAAVKKYAEELFALNEYTLTPDYADIWQPTGEWGSGSIWEMEYYTQPVATGWGYAGRKGVALSVAMRTRNDNAGTIPIKGGAPKNGWGFHLPTKSLHDEFEDGDPRRSCTMHSVPDSLSQVYNPTVDRTSDDTLSYPKNGFYNRKYSTTPWSDYIFLPGSSMDNQGHNVRLIRLADIYLLYAEAMYAEGNEAVAREYVNKVRARARTSSSWAEDEITRLPPNPTAGLLPDITATGDDLLQAIYHERRVELGMEFERMWDLFRTGRESIISDLWPNFQTPKHYYLPIPRGEIEKSGGILVQHPGW